MCFFYNSGSVSAGITGSYLRNLLFSASTHPLSVSAPPANEAFRDRTLSTCRFPTYLAVTPELTTATLIWSNAGTGIRYDIRWRRYDSADEWSTVTGITSVSYTLTNLTPSTLYEWQLQSVCTDSQVSGFIGIATFRTLTPACSSMYTIKDGLWSDPAIWSCLRVPAKGEKVTVNHTVTIPPLIAGTAGNIVLAGGKILFSQAATLRLNP
ncbi:fibronectin type III domain-containing protein [Arsenicibacter rosenii]|uniref:Fibronectin type-III domain-containing protein n=1 Tax=Arsenicibacter rosenii TaxID=1750698 RepID=A0A1S2VEW5_9BACT|nr:fibronectin type III domain-containing protein [Arsenicibacter rosenii]OIN57291.1 hypothetical protein BLX24_20110 [Arsenicibacter rosenii]